MNSVFRLFFWLESVRVMVSQKVYRNIRRYAPKRLIRVVECMLQQDQNDGQKLVHREPR